MSQRPDADAEAEAAQATREAIGSGTDVIYQGVLLGMSPDAGTALLGRPDFLVRAGLLAAPDGEPRPGELHYEVVDAKLARTAKARAVAQTAFYSHLLAGLQGVWPRWMHLAHGRGNLVALPLGRPVQRPQAPRRRPVARRRDHQGPAADAEDGRGVDQARAGILGRGPAAGPVAGGQRGCGPHPVRAIGSRTGRGGGLLINRGLLALPEPASGDLFFDIEGARYYSEDGKEFGLQYLFGIVNTVDIDARGRPRYTQIWAFDRPGEKHAFEKLVDFITERRRRHPGLYVYHNNHYEPTSVDHLTELHGTRQEAVGRLMGRFATCEDEVDDLFRRGVFVDLYRVVRQGVRAGVESYSIKRLEPLAGYTRQMNLPPYNAQIRVMEEALAQAGCSAGVRVGTVDKFQGHEAPVAIYSMATSSADDAPRGLEFLYDPAQAERGDIQGQGDGGRGGEQ